MDHKSYKVLIYSSWYPTTKRSAGNFAREQALALALRGHDVTVLLFRYLSIKDWILDRLGIKKLDHWIKDNDLSYITVDYLKWLPSKFRSDRVTSERQGMKKSLRRALSQNRVEFDVLHVHSLTSHPFVAKWVHQELNLPFVITEHYSAYRADNHEIFEPFSSKEEVIGIFEKASFRFAVSPKYAEHYESYFGIPFDSLPNPVSDQFTAPEFQPIEGQDPFRFLCVGNLWEHKGQHLLIEAFAGKFRDDLAVISIAGSGPELDNLKSLAKKEGVSDRVDFIGQLSREEVVAEMDRSHALVVPSYYETFSIVCVEALVRGRPVVAVRNGGPESIINSKNGLLFEQRDASDLGEKMHELFSDYSRFDLRGIREDAIDKYSEDTIVDRLTAIYGRAIDSFSKR